MRPLTEEEVKTVFEKLNKYLGDNAKQLLERDEKYVFRLHKDRIYYLTEQIAKQCMSFPRKNLVSAGICLGKFTHSKKFHLQITCLEYLAQLARYKIWLKSSGEQNFIYGNHVVRAHLKKITENVPNNSGVVVFNEWDMPLGFGTMAKSSDDAPKAGPEQYLVYHQADVGEYLRCQSDLV